MCRSPLLRSARINSSSLSEICCTWLWLELGSTLRFNWPTAAWTPVSSPSSADSLERESQSSLRLGFSFERMRHSFKRLGHPLKRLEHPLKRLGHPLRRLEHPLKRLEHPLKRSGHPLKRLEHPFKRLGHPFKRLRHPFKRLRHSFKRLAHPLKRLGQLLRFRGPLLRLRHSLLRSASPLLRRLGDPTSPGVRYAAGPGQTEKGDDGEIAMAGQPLTANMGSKSRRQREEERVRRCLFPAPLCCPHFSVSSCWVERRARTGWANASDLVVVLVTRSQVIL